jgi:glyoxylate/hydroxypyruvate reductase A
VSAVQTEIAFAAKDDEGFAAWEAALRRESPATRLLRLQEIGDGRGLRYCLAWRPPAGAFAKLPDLSVVFSMTAGVDKLLQNPEFPAGVTLAKMAEHGLTETMKQYVLWQVIHHHRRIWELAEAQREARWFDQLYPPPWRRKVGVLGLGAIGRVAAETLRDFQFEVRGWSRSPKTIAGVACFAGEAQLGAFLEGIEILVCLLPLTPETTGILNADLFAHLSPGAALINAARGGHLNEADLLTALATGRLSATTLDVTGLEPLPAGHPFWSHPRIFLTPHCAGDIDPDTAAPEIIRQIARHRASQPLEHVVDRERGY